MLRFAIPTAVALAFGAVLSPVIAVPAIAQGAPGEAADTMFWDSVKGSKDPAEDRAYLDKFPNGLFAPLARIRIRNLEASSGAPATPPSAQPAPSAQPRVGTPVPPQTPPPVPFQAPSQTPSTTQAPPPPSSTAPALTSPSVIREVQDRLFQLNYQVRTRNGRITEETRKAIRQWQENVKQPITGDMTEAQLVLLRRARIPTTWGAIAYFAKGASSTVWSRSTREAAESEALAACRKNAGGNCSVVTAADKGCAALGFYNAVVNGQQHWGAYAIVRPTLGQATDAALTECRQRSKQPTACGVRTSVCADGGHKR